MLMSVLLCRYRQLNGALIVVGLCRKSATHVSCVGLVKVEFDFALTVRQYSSVSGTLTHQVVAAGARLSALRITGHKSAYRYC